MNENTNFNNALEHSGLSMYALSKNSGVPYTTINELHNGKNDINQCAAGTVCRLSAAIGVQPVSILNPIYYLDGVKGRYRGIDFTWSTDGCSMITFEYEGERVTLNSGSLFNIPSRIKYYNIIAGWMIKEYISHRKWEKESKAVVERIKPNER